MSTLGIMIVQWKTKTVHVEEDAFEVQKETGGIFVLDFFNNIFKDMVVRTVLTLLRDLEISPTGRRVTMKGKRLPIDATIISDLRHKNGLHSSLK